MKEKTLIDTLIESEEAELAFDYDCQKLAFRSILRWAITNGFLKSAPRSTIRYSSDDGGCSWTATDKRPNRTAYPETGRFIHMRCKYGSSYYVQIKRDKRKEWYFEFRRTVLTPWQFLSSVIEMYTHHRMSDLLYKEASHRDHDCTSRMIAIGVLRHAKSLSDAAAILPFKMRMKDKPPTDFIDLARLIRAIQWITKLIPKHHEKENKQQRRPQIRIANPF